MDIQNSAVESPTWLENAEQVWFELLILVVLKSSMFPLSLMTPAVPNRLLFLIFLIFLTPLTFCIACHCCSGRDFPRSSCNGFVLHASGCPRVFGKGLGRVGPHPRNDFYEPIFNSADDILGPAGPREVHGGAAYMVAEACTLHSFSLQKK